MPSTTTCARTGRALDDVLGADARCRAVRGSPSRAGAARGPGPGGARPRRPALGRRGDDRARLPPAAPPARGAGADGDRVPARARRAARRRPARRAATARAGGSSCSRSAPTRRGRWCADERIVAESAGNPFFLLQLARGGDGVAEALASEFDALDPDARRLLDGAAVAGEPFEIDLAAAVAELDDPLPALDALVAADLVRATENPRRFAFRHPLVRRTVYDAAGAGWRLAAHARAAAALRAQGAPPSVARRPRRALGAARRRAGARDADPGRRGDGTRSPATAAHWYTAALGLLRDGDERRAGLLVGQAAALGGAGRLTEACDVLAEVVAALPPDAHELRARAVTYIARLQHPLGRHGEARALLQRTLAELPERALARGGAARARARQRPPAGGRVRRDPRPRRGRAGARRRPAAGGGGVGQPGPRAPIHGRDRRLRARRRPRRRAGRLPRRQRLRAAARDAVVARDRRGRARALGRLRTPHRPRPAARPRVRRRLRLRRADARRADPARLARPAHARPRGGCGRARRRPPVRQRQLARLRPHGAVLHAHAGGRGEARRSAPARPRWRAADGSARASSWRCRTSTSAPRCWRPASPSGRSPSSPRAAARGAGEHYVGRCWWELWTARAHLRLGDAAQAREWLDRASATAERDGPDRPPRRRAARRGGARELRSAGARGRRAAARRAAASRTPRAPAWPPAAVRPELQRARAAFLECGAPAPRRPGGERAAAARAAGRALRGASAGTLSAREQEIAELVGSGRTNRQIAARAASLREHGREPPLARVQEARDLLAGCAGGLDQRRQRR